MSGIRFSRLKHESTRVVVALRLVRCAGLVAEHSFVLDRLQPVAGLLQRWFDRWFSS